MTIADWVSGVHAVRSVLCHRPQWVAGMWVRADTLRSERVVSLQHTAQRQGVPVMIVDRCRWKARVPSSEQSASCVLALHTSSFDQEPKLWECLPTWGAKALCLALDGVTDPHNVGACLRAADACGAVCALLPRHGAARLSPVVLRSSAGAALSLPVFEVSNLSRVLSKLKRDHDAWVLGADAQGTPYHTWPLPPRDTLQVLVLGSEGKGMRRVVRAQCDAWVAIPMSGWVSSLNVSVAAGILLCAARDATAQACCEQAISDG